MMQPPWSNRGDRWRDRILLWLTAKAMPHTPEWEGAGLTVKINGNTATMRWSHGESTVTIRLTGQSALDLENWLTDVDWRRVEKANPGDAKMWFVKNDPDGEGTRWKIG